MKQKRFSIKNQLPNIVSILIGIIPIIILIQYYGVPRKLIIGWGVLSWIIGVAVLKMPVYHLLIKKILHEKFSHKWLGIIQGLVSAFSELGSAFIFFKLVLPQELTLPQLIGFGLAAGAVESILLPYMGNPLAGTPLEKHVSDIEKKTIDKTAMNWMGVVERVLALFLHVFSRGLIYLSIVSKCLVPGFIAILAFAAADGRGYYSLLEKWDFADMKVLRKFYYFLALLALILCVSFIFFYFLKK